MLLTTPYTPVLASYQHEDMCQVVPKTTIAETTLYYYYYYYYYCYYYN